MKLAVVTALSLALLAAIPVRALDWYRWRGPDGNGISKETGWQSQWPVGGPKLLWKASVGTGFSSVAVSQGRVFTLGNANNRDTVFCFDAATGGELWKHSYACNLAPDSYEGGPSATPTVDGNRVFTLSKAGDLFCFDAASGSMIWSTNLASGLRAEAPKWGFGGSPLVEGDLLILNVGSAGTALDKKTGKLIWTNGRDAAGYSSPVPFESGGERCIVMLAKADVIAVKAKDGKELWRHPWPTHSGINVADPIVAGDRVFVSAAYGQGAALLQITNNKPRVIWANKNMRNHFNSCVLWQGHLYGADENVLACITLATGTKNWNERAFGKGSLMLAGGMIIGLSDRGELMVAEASPTGFRPISRAQVLSGKCWTVPVLSNGKIYCRSASGDLVCLGVSPQKPTVK